MIDAAEGFDQRRQVMTGEIVHQPGKLFVGTSLDQLRRGRLRPEIAEQVLAPCRAALEDQRGIELVRALVDPLAQQVAARLGKGRFLQGAVFEDHHVPAERTEQRLVARPQAFADHGVEALPVVVDDPPAVPQPLLPALEDRLENITLVELGVPDQRDHPPFRAVESPAVRAHVVLDQRREQRLRHAEADRAGGEVHAVGVLGARRIALRALVAAERLEILPRLPPQQILDRMVDRRGVRLDRDAILRAQDMEVQRRHDRRQRSGRRLVASDLQPVDIFADVVGVMNRPTRQPQHFFLKRTERGQVFSTDFRRFGHIHVPQGAAPLRRSTYDVQRPARRCRRSQRSATRSTSLPKFSPLNSFSSVSGNVCSPSTMSSRDFSLPAAIQPAMSRTASG